MKKNIKKRIIIIVMLVLLFIINIPNIILNGGIVIPAINYLEAHYYMMKTYDMDYKILSSDYAMVYGYYVNILAENGTEFVRRTYQKPSGDSYYASYAEDMILKQIDGNRDTTSVLIIGDENYPKGQSEINIEEYIDGLRIDYSYDCMSGQKLDKNNFDVLMKNLENLDPIFLPTANIRFNIRFEYLNKYKNLALELTDEEFNEIMKNKNYDKLWERIQNEIKEVSLEK